MDESTFVILDLETTGLSPYEAGITEIYMRKVKNKECINEFHSFVNPGHSIPSFIQKLTGIDDDMVKDAPLANEIINPVKEFIGDSIVVGHNINFDMKFLNYFMGIQNDRICTLLLSRRVFSLDPLLSYKLSNICNNLNIVVGNTHRAKDDVLLTEKLFYHILDALSNKNIRSVDSIRNFQNLTISKSRNILAGISCNDELSK